MGQNREMITQYASNSNIVDISCTDCSWRENRRPASGRTTQQEERAVFDHHKCEEYPRCGVDDCHNRAAYGFRELMDGNTMTTSGFSVVSSINWCLGHDAEMRTRYASKDGEFVGPL